MREDTYYVHLKSGVENVAESPLEGSKLDFYDTGLWVHREEGRDFFPYEQVLMVQERSEPAGSEQATAEGSEQ